ncbi:MAG: hypothetical protein IT544_01040 [Rhodobacteraceae bacterium]|nr:hypothetical protein [Paracoccaceae bacterium]
MQDLVELERRINAALQRIEAGVEALPVVPVADAVEIDKLKAELVVEKTRNAALRQELVEHKPTAKPASELEVRVEQLMRQIDVQGIEMQRMRKNVMQLRESLSALRRLASEKLADPEMINLAMQAELESIRVTRLAEMAELDEIIAELDPMIVQQSREVQEYA